jgi:hypothetical protein
VPEIPSNISSTVARLGARLDKQRHLHNLLESYVEGETPLPRAIVRAKITRAYRMLMPMSEAPWASLIVSSTQDRLEASGLNDVDKDVANACWDLWQNNAMDLESKVAHNSILVDGRAAAIVWREPGSDFPTVSLDNMGTTVVQFKEGSRRERTAALRHWIDEDTKIPNATLYTVDALYKFKGPKYSSGASGTQWEPRIVTRDDGTNEPWPLPNPYKVVPAVELAINRRLKPGRFPYARGEFEKLTGLIDRINLLTFLGLVVAFYMGFPLRGVVGERILKDDEGKPIAPFDAHASGLFQLENKDAKVVQLPAADRDNLSIFAELDQLATLSKTPRHYFPMKGGMQNLAADAIRASEGALHAKVTDHKAPLGEGWEEVTRLLGLMSDDHLELSPRAELQWKDHESRSLAERADAASKLKETLPPIAIAEKVLNFTQDEWRRWAAEGSANQLAGVVAAALQPQPQVPTIPATAGGILLPTNGGQPAR